MQQPAQPRLFERKSDLIRPYNLRFPYAVTPRSNSRKSFSHYLSYSPLVITIQTLITFPFTFPIYHPNPHYPHSPPSLLHPFTILIIYSLLIRHSDTIHHSPCTTCNISIYITQMYNHSINNNHQIWITIHYLLYSTG